MSKRLWNQFTAGALAILLGAVAAGAQALDAFPRASRIEPGDLMLVQTNSAGAAGQKFSRSITASNFLESMITFPNWNGVPPGFLTNVNQLFTNVIVVNPGPSDIANGILLTNAVKQAGTLASASRPFLVRLMPGKYGTPTNTLPSVMMGVDNVSTYWEPGAVWWSGTQNGESSFMWDDQAGARTNVNIYGFGRFYYTNEGGASIYLENASRMFAQARSIYATNVSSTATPITWGGAAMDLTVDIDDFIESGSYDAAYGDVAAGQKFRGFIREVRAKGDLLEFTSDSPTWGNVDIRFDIGRVTQPVGQPTWVQIGGRTKVRGSQVFITATNASIGSASTATNGVLEVGEVQYPEDGKVPAIRGNTPSLANLLIRNTTIYGPSNMAMVGISNSAARPLILENVTFNNGWNTTTWGSGLTPSFVDIVGTLTLKPYRPVGSQLTIRGTNYVSAIRNVGSYVGNGELIVSNNITTTGDLTVGGTINGNAAVVQQLLASAQANLPNGAGPFSPTAGDLYFDTDWWAAGRGTWLTWDGTANVVIPGILASDTPSNGQIPTWNTGGTITWESPTAAGTNNPVTLSAGTLTLIASQTARYYTNTAASFPFVFSGTPNASAIITLAVSNSAATVNYITNTAGIYDGTVASNVTTFSIAAQSQRNFRFIRNATSGWELDGSIGKEYEIAAGTAISLATNGGTITISAAGNTNLNALQITNRLAFGVTNIVVTNTSPYHLDLSRFTLFRVALLTNATLVFTNQGEGLQRAQVIVQQDTNGQRVTDWSVAGGLLQTNANLQVTTNANASELLEVCTPYFTTNLFAWWPQNFQPRIPFTNSLAGVPLVTFFRQSFEGTTNGGFDNSEVWTTSGGSVNPNTNIFVIDGAESLLLGANSNATSPTNSVSNMVAHLYFTFATSTTNSQHEIFSVNTNTAAGQVGRVFVRATGRLSLNDLPLALFTASPASGVPTNTLIHVWQDWDWSIGSAELAWSTDGIKPTSGPQWTNGVISTNLVGGMNRVRFNGATGVSNYFDKFLASTNAIGSNPL